MDEVNIYIMTSNKSPARVPTAGEYIIEVIRDGIPTTYPPPNKSVMLKEITTGRIMAAKLLGNALYILTKLSGIKCDKAMVYIEPYNSAMPFLMDWLDKWQHDRWMDSKGDPIDDTYIKLKEWIDKSVPLTFKSCHHSYSDVLNGNMEKYKKVTNALNATVERSSEFQKISKNAV